MHFAADLPNEIHRAQSAGKINDAKMHFNLVLFPPGMPTTSHPIVSMLLWQFWSKLRRTGQARRTPSPRVSCVQRLVKKKKSQDLLAVTQRPGQPPFVRSEVFPFDK